MPIHNTTIRNARAVLNKRTGEVEYSGDLDGITVEGRDLRGLSPYEKVKLKANRGQLYNAFSTPDPYSIDASNFGESEEESSSAWKTAAQIAGTLALGASMYGGHKVAPKVNAQRSNVIGTARHLVRGQTPSTNPFHVGLMGNSAVARRVNNFINRHRPIDITSLSPEYGVQLSRNELGSADKGFSVDFPLRASIRKFKRQQGREALSDLYRDNLYHHTDDLIGAYGDFMKDYTGMPVNSNGTTPIIYSSKSKNLYDYLDTKLGKDVDKIGKLVKLTTADRPSGFAIAGYPYTFSDIDAESKMRDWKDMYSTLIHEANHVNKEPLFRANSKDTNSWNIGKKTIQGVLERYNIFPGLGKESLDHIASNISNDIFFKGGPDEGFFNGLGTHPKQAEDLSYYLSGEEMSSRGSQILFDQIFPNVTKSGLKGELPIEAKDAMKIRKTLFDKYTKLGRLDKAVENTDLSINRYNNYLRKKKK